MVIRIKYNKNKEQQQFARRKSQYIKRSKILNIMTIFLVLNQQLLNIYIYIYTWIYL